MYPLICRVMMVVFLLNCLTPTQVLGQTSRGTNNPAQQVQAPVRPAELFEQALLMRDLQVLQVKQKSPLDLSALQQGQLLREKSAARDTLLMGKMEVNQQAIEQAAKRVKELNTLREKVAGNNILLEELVDYVDPLTDTNPNLQTVAYAAEIIGNTVAVYAKAKTTAQEEEILESLLPVLEARMVHQLDRMNHPALVSTYIKGKKITKVLSFDNLYSIEAVGSLRMALLHIGAYYSQHQKVDPLEDYTQQQRWAAARSPQAQAARAQRQEVQRQEQRAGIRDMYVQRADATYTNRPVQPPVTKQVPTRRATPREAGLPVLAQDKKTKGSLMQSVTRAVAQAVEIANKAKPANAPLSAPKALKDYANLKNFHEDFVVKLQDLNSRRPQEGSKERQYMQLWADYATAYALEYDIRRFADIVKVFDTGVRKGVDGVSLTPGEFKQENAPVLAAIFNSAYEHVRYSDMSSAQTKQMLDMLMEFSDPTKYSLPTRVFALEAASRLYRPFRQQTLHASAEELAQTQYNLMQNYVSGGKATLGGAPLGDKYFPVNMNKPDETMRRIFAQRVSALYCSLSDRNKDGKYQTYGLAAEEMQALSDKLAYMYDGFYDISTPTFVETGKKDPHQDYSSCAIYMKNEPNKYQQAKETREEVFSFTLTTIFWASMLADGFALLGTAWRLTRGAIAALPRVRSLAEVWQGARFNNWVYKGIKQQGYRVELEVQTTTMRTEKILEAAANGTTKEVLRKVPNVETKFVPINHTRQLQRYRSLWNPKRYVKGKKLDPNEKITGARVTVTRPGMENIVGTMKFETPVDGIHSLKGIQNMVSQLRLADGSAMPFIENVSYFRGLYNTRQVQTEYNLLGSLNSGMQKATDVVAPVRFKGNGEAFAPRLKGAVGEEGWWNITQWGPVEGLEPVGTKLYVVPKTKLWGPKPDIGKLTTEELYARTLRDVPDRLPGFYTTQQALQNGEIYTDAFKALFKQVEHKNWVSRFFLPDYMPTKTLLQMTRANPLIGMKLFPNMVSRSRLFGTAAFFGLLSGADYMAYPLMRGWLEKEAGKDMQAEMNKYGDTFSPQQNKMDERLLEELGANGGNEAYQSAYNAVLEHAPQPTEGTLFTAPIVLTRRALGWMPLVNDAGKVRIAHEAYRKDFNRDRLKQLSAANQVQQAYGENAGVETVGEQAANEDEEVRAFKQNVQREKEAVLADHAQGFAAFPNARKQVEKLYAQYIEEMLAAQTEQEVDNINEKYQKLMQEAFLSVNAWEEKMQECQDELETLKWIYSQDPEFITPQIEKEIRALYENYARQYVSITAKDEETYTRKTNDLFLRFDKQLSQMEKKLEKQWNKKHPQGLQPAGKTETEEFIFGDPNRWRE